MEDILKEIGDKADVDFLSSYDNLNFRSSIIDPSPDHQQQQTTDASSPFSVTMTSLPSSLQQPVQKKKPVTRGKKRQVLQQPSPPPSLPNPPPPPLPPPPPPHSAYPPTPVQPDTADRHVTSDLKNIPVALEPYPQQEFGFTDFKPPPVEKKTKPPVEKKASTTTTQRRSNVTIISGRGGIPIKVTDADKKQPNYDTKLKKLKRINRYYRAYPELQQNTALGIRSDLAELDQELDNIQENFNDESQFEIGKSALLSSMDVVQKVNTDYLGGYWKLGSPGDLKLIVAAQYHVVEPTWRELIVKYDLFRTGPEMRMLLMMMQLLNEVDQRHRFHENVSRGAHNREVPQGMQDMYKDI